MRRARKQFPSSNIGLNSPFKFNARASGLLVYHNTAIGDLLMPDPFSNAHFRNNLFLGSDRPGRPLVSAMNVTAYSTYDYNGYRPNRGIEANYRWAAPPDGQFRHDALSMKELGREFRTLAEWSRATGHESHGIELDYDAFTNLAAPDPDPMKVSHATDLNFALRPGSKAVDAGTMLPTLNDDFTGTAPDLGALELGQPAPIYGPRWLKPGDIFYR